ncbi:5082_t:CDS:1, partial [Funneliformis caledonium]
MYSYSNFFISREYDKLLSEIKEDENYDKNKRDNNKHLKTN